MSKFLIIFILTINFQSCGISPNRNLENTKWVNNDLGCTDYFLFGSESKYEFYSCELQELVYGMYSVNSDTLKLEEIKGEFDNEFHENSRHRAELQRSILVRKDETLQFVKSMTKDESGNWVDLKLEVENYIFTIEK